MDDKTRLAQWLELNGWSITDLSRASFVAYPTCHKAFHGRAIEYPVAKKISLTTNGAVTIDELCMPEKKRTGT